MVAQCPIFIRDAEKVCRDAGATEVLRDEPLAAINGLHEGSFDAVIDTVGGRRRERFPRSFRHWLFFWADDVSAFFAQSTTPRGESCTTAAPLSPRSATL